MINKQFNDSWFALVFELFTTNKRQPTTTTTEQRKSFAISCEIRKSKVITRCQKTNKVTTNDDKLGFSLFYDPRKFE